MIRVGIADDHQLFVDGLSNALGAIPDMRVVLTASSATELLSLMPDSQVDVLLLDLDMPGGGGLAVLTSGHIPPTIVVTMHADAASAGRALAAGTRAFLPKSVPLLELAAAIRAVADHTTVPFRPEARREALAKYLSPRLDPGAASLTDRERELLKLLARGITSTTEIAEHLFISPKTVKNHLASIFSKLAVSDRAQAAVEAIRLGITDSG